MQHRSAGEHRSGDWHPGCAMKTAPELSNTQPLLLTVEEAAKALQISRSLLYEEMRRRRVRVVKIRHLTRIRQAELERYIRECEAEGL